MYYISKKVDYSDCDPTGHLRISAAIRYMQQCSSEQMSSLDIGYRALHEKNMVFLLNKTCIKVYNAPISEQDITLGTAALRCKGTRFYREFVIDSQEGERLISALTVWILVDPENRKIYRAGQFPYNLNYEESLTEGEIDEMFFPKVEETSVPTKSAQRVGYSLLDNNGHVNNSFYADFVCDAIPYEKLIEQGLDKIAIGYKNEARHGDTVIMQTHQLNEKEYLIHGCHDQTPCFEALAIFK